MEPPETIAARSPESAPRMPDSWRTAVIGGGLLWLASRTLVTLVAMLSRLATTGGPLSGQPFWRLLFNWDSDYFIEIAKTGYFVSSRAAKLPAFFPGYPGASALLAKALPFTGDPVGWGMFGVNVLAGLAAAILLWRLAEHTGGGEVAFTATALFVFSPYAVFLHASYSEPLFLAFAVGAWYAGTRESWWLAGLLAAGASFTRVNGLFLVAALVVMYLVAARRAGAPVLRWAALGPLLGGLGAAAYIVWLWTHTGSFSTWQHAQKVGWGRQTKWPWDSLAATVRYIHSVHPSFRPQYALDIVFGVGAMLVIVWLIVKRQWPTVVYAGLTLGVMVTSSRWMSVARNTLTMFPIAVALAVACAQGTWRRRALTVVLVFSVALLAFNTHQFTLRLWAD